MICELRREEEEGLLTAVGDRESWKEKGGENIQGLARRVRMSRKKKFDGEFSYLQSRICTRTVSVTTRSVVSSASGEWKELMLFLGVLLGLGQDDRFSGEPGPNPRDIYG